MFGISEIAGKLFSIFNGWGIVYFWSLGGNIIGVGDINNHLQSANYPKISPYNISSSGEFGIFAKKYFISKRNLTLWHRNYSNSSNLVGFGGNCWYISLGRLFNLKYIKILPQVGMGRSEMDLTVGKNVMDFDSLLINPGRITSLNRKSLVLVPYMRVFAKRKWVLFFSGGMGYILPFYKSPWEIEGIGKVNGPSTAFGGLVVDLALGLGLLIE